MSKKQNPNKDKSQESTNQEPEEKIKPYRSYFETRIYDELGLKPEQNKIKLKIEDIEAGRDREVEHEIFSEDENGNITITPFDLDRYLIQYDTKGATPTRPNINNSRRKIFKVTRFKIPEVYTNPKTQKEETKKYDFPKGAKTEPFRPPGLVKKWEKKQKIETLALTEGYFKAMAGDINGLDIIGLSSISHYKEKETEMMYSDVLRIINDCQVENVIILYDGDARNISSKDLAAGRDLRRRPHGFIRSALKVRELLKDTGVDIYYAEVNSQELKNGNPKGLDDLYQVYRDEAKQITKDLTSFSRPTSFFNRFSIRFDPSKLYQWFQFTTVETFYQHHSEAIQGREFVYSGTTYTYNDKTGNCEIKIPGEASDYFRVGDDYYKWVNVPNKYEQTEKKFMKRSKATIKDDHRNQKNFTDFIPRYEAFCNVPSHNNYRSAINSCFNVYAPFEHEAEEGDCPVTLEFIKHIFQEHYELGLDYIQLLYQRPTQTLPILCLVSKENKTGKSTFIKLLKAIFKQNCTIIGNAELNSEFNAGWSTKLIVGCEETLVDKKPTIEKIKALSTADQVNMNRKGKDHEEIDFFAKFILASNNEKNFIYATKSDIRYWVRKVPVINGAERVNMLQEMIDEIPAFLNFLNKRKMHTANETRMWFREDLLKTEALEKLVKNSRTGIEKEVYEFAKDVFLEFGEKEIFLSPKDVIELVLKRKADTSYVRDILKDNFKVELYDKSKVRGYKIPYWGTEINLGEEKNTRKEYARIGRPYHFKVANILDKDDLKTWNDIHGQKPEPEPEIQEPKK
ncbi:DUF5906 domain-containing protein, partial [Draconibacterium sp.]|nr:DUF5906 domain-containing protein [Draconibacterium sp.]